MLVKYLSVYFTSMVKFVFGPPLAFATGIDFAYTILLTVSGMMTTVVIFTFIGERLREKLLKRFYSLKVTSNNKRVVKIWRRYGVFGVSFLTPILFSPIGGSIILTTFGADKRRIIIFMLISAVFWSFTLSYLVYFLGYKFG